MDHHSERIRQERARRRFRHHQAPEVQTPEEEEIVWCRRAHRTSLWILRCLLTFDRRHRLVTSLKDDGISEAIGLESLPGSFFERADDRKTANTLLRNLFARREQWLSDHVHRHRDLLWHNAGLLAEALHLSDAERCLLVFAAGCQHFSINSLTGGVSGRDRFIRTLAAALEVTNADLRRALSPDGILLRSRLLEFNVRGARNNICLDMDDQLLHALGGFHRNRDSLLDGFFRKAGAPKCDLRDFDWMGKPLALAVEWLGRAVESRRKGVNVLISGPPGTGKTELSLCIARHLGVALQAINVEDNMGDCTDSHERRGFYRMAQGVLAHAGNTIILFDEAEDLFVRDWNSIFSGKTASTGEKGWMNRALETNPVPTIWVTNHSAHMDDAYLRRFDFILQLASPPTAHRRKVLANALGRVRVGDDLMARLSENPSVTVADVARAAGIARGLPRRNRAERAAIVEHAVECAVEGRGARFHPGGYAFDAASFDTSLLNLDCDVNILCDGLLRQGSGSICMVGPPGTGKTAFAHHLSGQLGRRLHRVCASDLLNPFVGGTEQNIARLFRQADKEEDIIFLDEADSFFRTRELARNSWEVTQVNELLTRVESFNGVFLCSTNLIGDFDPAAMRRFSMKIRFDYLTDEQCRRMLGRVANALGAPVTDEAQARVARLSRLTPGDFAAVEKRLRLVGAGGVDGILRALEEECAWKKDRGRRVGFLSKA